jgi:hypothetical protein
MGELKVIVASGFFVPEMNILLTMDSLNMVFLIYSSDSLNRIISLLHQEIIWQNDKALGILQIQIKSAAV